MAKKLKLFVEDESGATVTEYAILITVVAVSVIAVVLTFRWAINDALSAAVEQIRSARETK